MKPQLAIALSLTAAGLSLPAFAHDPSQHQAKDAVAPDCSKMKDMDMSKMDMNDPVLKAIHEKCNDQMKHDEMKDMPGMTKKTAPPTEEDNN